MAKATHNISRSEAWHKRHALQLAAQLPDNKADAIAILTALMELIENIWDDPTMLQKQNELTVIQFKPQSCRDSESC